MLPDPLKSKTVPESSPNHPGGASDRPADFGWSSAWSLKHRLISTVVGGGAAVIGAWGLFPLDQADVHSWILVAFMGFLSFHGFRRAFDPRPRFEVTPDGITDRTALGGGDLFIRWEEIREVRDPRFLGILEVLVRDPSLIRKRAGWPRRLWMMLGAAMGKREISITADALGPNMTELRGHVEAGLFAFERAELGLPPLELAGEERLNELGTIDQVKR